MLGQSGDKFWGKGPTCIAENTTDARSSGQSIEAFTQCRLAVTEIYGANNYGVLRFSELVRLPRSRTRGSTTLAFAYRPAAFESRVPNRLSMTALAWR